MHRLFIFPENQDDTLPSTEEILSTLPCGCRRRAERYKLEDDRRRSAVCYYLLKRALSEVFGVSSFDIIEGEHGKPHLSDRSDIHFSISHSDNVCICVVSDRTVGADVQEIRGYSERTAKKVCCENEIALLGKSADKDTEFTRIWAMKESYIKMNGCGFSYGLKNADTTKMKSTEVFRKNNCFIAVSEEY